MRFVGMFVLGLAACAGQSEVQKPLVAAPAADEELVPEIDRESIHGGGQLECVRASEFGPVSLSPDEYRARNGVGVTRVADATSSKERPIEVCSVEGQLEWLVALTCADGSHPFSTGPEAHASRSGNVGSGGRCDSIIDLYIVPCPEGAVEVYMDLYMCPQ